MRARDLVFLVASNLRRMKMRLALTTLGVVIGTSAIVLMISLGVGLQNNVTQGLGEMGAATHINVMGGVMVPGAEMKPLTDQTLDELRAVEHVEAVVPTVYVQTIQGFKYKRQQGFLNAQGASMEDLALLGYELEDGRYPRNEKEILLGASAVSFFDERGDQSGPKAIDLMGKKLVVTFFEPSSGGDGEGSEVKEAAMEQPVEFSRKLTVVGVLKKSDMQTDQTAYMPIDFALELNGVSRRRPTYEQVIVKVDSPAVVGDVEKGLNKEGYQTFSAVSMQEGLKQTFLVIQAVLGALGAIAMLVASLGIANTMTMSIFERTREIGIMKALGASNRQIKRVFLGEAAIIGVLGGLGGLLLSASGAALANLFVRGIIASQSVGSGGGGPEVQSFFDISPTLAVFAIAFAAAVGLLAGVLPAVRAANLDPLSALRHE